jgi:enolase
MQIEEVRVRVCFNGRGDPGIEAEVTVGGKVGRALSPSGASRGTNEAQPFSDDSPEKTVERFQSFKRDIIGVDAADAARFSNLLRSIDTTKNYSNIGGSMAYALSVAAAEAEANARGVPLCRAIDPSSHTLPFPIGNVIGGGKHASDLSPSIQEIMVAPIGAQTVKEAVTLNLEVHRRIGKKLSKTLSYPLGKGDEGGWAPGITDEEAIKVAWETAAEVQDERGRKIRVGVDIAADSLYDPKKGGYYYRSTKKTLARDAQISFIGEIRDRFELFFIEDPLYEDDFEGYANLHSSLGGTYIVGDDIYTTDPKRLERGISAGSTNAVIVKVNQIGTLGEAQQFSRMASENAQILAASHRSGDNEGGHLAHFAVGFGCALIKCGVVGGERMSKLNELIRIADTLEGAQMYSWKSL